MSTPFQQSPYLRGQRAFPTDDIKGLSAQVDQAYIDIALKMNARTIGLFANNQQITTGENWYITSKTQQSLRKMFTFTTSGSFAHGLTISQIGGFSRLYGTFQDSGGVWYPLPYVSVSMVGAQVALTVDSTNINITATGGSPSISKGFVVVEYLELPKSST